MCMAFPYSEYYDRSDASARHRETVSLYILVEASHVHDKKLCDIP
jgi:hypothetical protein